MSSLQARTFSRTAGTAVNYAARLELLESYLAHHEDIELFSWPLSDSDDPLIAALASPGAVPFKSYRPNGYAAQSSSTPLGRGAFTAVPLGLRSGTTDADETAPGLLLLRTPAITPDINWVLTVLGQKID